MIAITSEPILLENGPLAGELREISGAEIYYTFVYSIGFLSYRRTKRRVGERIVYEWLEAEKPAGGK